MKQSILFVGALVISLSATAQKDNFSGKWSEKRYTFVDTTDVGRDLISANYDDYSSGRKVLDRKFIAIQEGFNENILLKITKEKEQYWAMDELGLKYEIHFDSAIKKYYITFKQTLLELKYDVKTKNLYLIDPKEKNTFYEFKRTL
ncbi:hypothetical protein [Flavobacterium sp. SM2513]|uniref:hypothetical protein n=1 Tax=Flavobacterium sp. SM2513 TaxID=3424766 RepID=UPI003D7F99CF